MTTIPATPEQADAWFRCERLSCSMAGSACAARWARAQTEGSGRWGKLGIEGDECRGCPLGAARHKLGSHLRAPQLLTIEAPRQAAPQTDEEDIMIPSAFERVHGYVEEGSCTAADVAAALNLSLSTVHKHLQTMLADGTVERDKPEGGGAYRYCPVFRQSAPPPPPEPPPPMPLDPDPPAAPPPAAEVVELQPEVSTEAVPEPPEVTPAQIALDRAAHAYIAARDALQAGAELAVQKIDDGVEVEVIAVAEGLQRLADALQEAYRRLDEARNAVAADRYDALLAQMGVAA